jgi:hypothetical protein
LDRLFSREGSVDPYCHAEPFACHSKRSGGSGYSPLWGRDGYFAPRGNAELSQHPAGPKTQIIEAQFNCAYRFFKVTASPAPSMKKIVSKSAFVVRALT